MLKATEHCLASNNIFITVSIIFDWTANQPLFGFEGGKIHHNFIFSHDISKKDKKSIIYVQSKNYFSLLRPN